MLTLSGQLGEMERSYKANSSLRRNLPSSTPRIFSTISTRSSSGCKSSGHKPLNPKGLGGFFVCIFIQGCPWPPKSLLANHLRKLWPCTFRLQLNQRSCSLGEYVKHYTDTDRRPQRNHFARPRGVYEVASDSPRATCV
jgi:hypothetical protein